jgi:hypothetical protein
LPSIIRIIKVEDDEPGGSCSTYGEKRNSYRLLVGKPEGKRPLGRPRRRWVDNVRIDLGEVGLGDVDWIGLVSKASLKSDRNRKIPCLYQESNTGCPASRYTD